MAKEVTAQEVSSYAKEDLIASASFADVRHFAAALLKDGERYTVADARKLINDYLSQGVK